MVEPSGGQTRIGQYTIEKRAVTKEASRSAVGWGCSTMILVLIALGVIGGIDWFGIGFVPTILAGCVVMIVVQVRAVGRWKREWRAANERAAPHPPEGPPV